MQVNYTVHSVAQEPVPVQATYDNRTVTATVPGVTVELVSDTQSNTIRYVPNGAGDLAACLALFTVGAAITATFTHAS